jgi:hypothetical protein
MCVSSLVVERCRMLHALLLHVESLFRVILQCGLKEVTQRLVSM